MRDLLPLLQLIFAFWPLTLLAALRGWWRGRGERFPIAIRRGLISFLILWFLFAIAGLLLITHQLPLLGFLPQSWNTAAFIVTGAAAGSLLLGLEWWQNRGVWHALRTARSVQDLQALSPGDFEELVAAFFRSFGHRVRRVGKTGDHGVDLVVYTRDQGKWIVQCKRYRSSVGEPVVRDFFGAMHHEAASRGFLMTTGSFTPQAMEWVRGKPITLYDGPGLVKLLRSCRKMRRWR